MSNNFAYKVLTKTKLKNIWSINNDNKLSFNLTVKVHDIKYEKNDVDIYGEFPDGPYKKPKITWKHNIYNKPSKLTYQAGGEYNTCVGRWLDSTLVENTVENLFIAYILAKKYDTLHLIPKHKWDELFYSRSYFTQNGSWRPFNTNNCDNVIKDIINEMKFFGELKYMISYDLTFFKSDKIDTDISPIQNKFIYNEYIVSILKLIDYISNYEGFDVFLFKLIFSFIPDNNIYKQIWNLDIFNWKTKKEDLIKHFMEFNKIRQYLE